MSIEIKQELGVLVGYSFECEGREVHVKNFSSITEAESTDISFCYSR